MQEYFSISAVSKTSGASKKQIRNWTEKGYIGKVHKVIMDGRAMTFYSQENIDIATKIYDYLEEGYTLTGAVLQVNSEK